MNGTLAITIGAAFAAFFATASPVAHAQDPVAFDSEAPLLAPARLDALRGGFVLPSGLVLSFGIERAVYIDGALVASTRVSVPDLANLTTEQARDLAALQDTLYVRVGAGNTLQSSSGPGGVVIQNALDGQAIRVSTTLDASVGTLGLFQELNANAALQSAINGATGGP